MNGLTLILILIPFAVYGVMKRKLDSTRKELNCWRDHAIDLNTKLTGPDAPVINGSFRSKGETNYEN